jgi:threonine/homoserine/homoserine lactone efflux protein
VGHLLWGVGSAIGVAALVSASTTVYLLLRLMGGAYLLWLGLHAWVSAGPAAAGATTQGITPAPVTPARGALGPYRQGLVNDLLNPKIGAFYTTLLPQFIAPGQPVVQRSLLLAALMALIVALWLALYVAILDKVTGFYRRPSVSRALERILGVTLIALGVHLWFFG